MEIYVGNISFGLSEGDLQDAFEQFGAVSQLKIITDRETGRSRGFGFITMDSAEEGQAAIAGLNGQELDGRELSVREATPRAPRAPRGGGGGGGFRGGDRPRGGGFRGGDRPRGGGGGHRGNDRRGGDRRGGGYQDGY